MLTAALLAVLLVAVPAFSQDSTAVKQERRTSHVILTKPDFEKINAESVGDALVTITGVYVNAQGEVSLRDVSASKVVVVMDGQKLNVAGGSGVNVSNISIENVESIELLRGGRSAEYGADAVGGVIVINTKGGKQEGAETAGKHSLAARTTFGSYNRQIMSVSDSYQRGSLNGMVSYRRDIWSGNFEYTDNRGDRQVLENNNTNSHSIFGKLGTSLSEKETISGSYSYYKADNGTPGMIGQLTEKARIRFDNHSVNTNYSNRDLFSGFGLDAGVYYLNYRTRFDDPVGQYPTHSDHKNYAVGVDLKQAGKVSELTRISYGYSFRNDRIESTDVGSRKRDTHSAFTTISLANAGDMLTDMSGGLISSWDVALAARYDEPTDFRSELSPRLSMSLTNANPVMSTTLQSHIAKSYRAPTFNDLYWPRDAFAMGNPDLEPETSLNYDVGLNVQVPVMNHSVSAAVNYFRNDVKNLILWAPVGPNGLWIPENISDTETWGIETSGSVSLFDGMVSTNAEYTYMKAINRQPQYDGRYIIYRPKNKLSLTGTVKLHGVEWNVVYSYNGLRYINRDNTDYLPKYTLLDTNISYTFKLYDVSLTTSLEATNITDEDFMRVNGTAEPGRMFKGTLWVRL
jgi:outer membrane receptor for ferrienterochelin and colicins